MGAQPRREVDLVPCPRCDGGKRLKWLMETDVGEPCVLCDQAFRVPRYVAGAYILLSERARPLFLSIRDTRKLCEELGFRDA